MIKGSSERFLFGTPMSGGFIKDLCYSVWVLCHEPKHEDGNTDWFNDTLPTVEKGKEIIQKHVNSMIADAIDDNVLDALETAERYLNHIHGCDQTPHPQKLLMQKLENAIKSVKAIKDAGK